MDIKMFPTDLLGVNCYVVFSANEALIIDPAGAREVVLDYLVDQKLCLKSIVNTHGHGDHIAGNGFFQEKTNAPVAIHHADQDFLTNSELNLSYLIGQECCEPAADKLLDDGEIITLGAESLHVWHTPGHTPGSICLVSDTWVITGDTLFAGSIGRTDLPGGDGKKLAKSLKALEKLPPKFRVYPGHGEATTIGQELATNPFLGGE